MAQRVNVVLIDDIDESEGAETVTFGLDGATYEIDLSAENADKLREALALYIAHGRRSTGASSGGRRGRGQGRRSSGGSADGPSTSDIRAWAREQGHEVSDRGRVSSEIREAYSRAH